MEAVGVVWHVIPWNYNHDVDNNAICGEKWSDLARISNVEVKGLMRALLWGIKERFLC